MNKKSLSNSSGIIGFIQALVGLGLLVALGVALNGFFSSRSSQTTSQLESTNVLQSPSTLQIDIEGGRLRHPIILSPDGQRIAYLTEDYALAVANSDGSNPTRLTDPINGAVRFYAWAPDAKRIAYEFKGSGDNVDLFLVDVEEKSIKQLTSDPHLNEMFPDWSPDGQSVVYSSGTVSLRSSLRVLDIGNGEIRQLTEAIGAEYPVWSPDGTKIAFSISTELGSDVWIIDSRGYSSPQRLTEGELARSPVVWSPDGKLIAFVSDKNQANQPPHTRELTLKVIDLSGNNLRNIVSPALAPHWVNSSNILYLDTVSRDLKSVSLSSRQDYSTVPLTPLETLSKESGAYVSQVSWAQDKNMVCVVYTKPDEDQVVVELIRWP